MRKYVGFSMIGVLVLPILVYGFIAFPIAMILAFGGTFFVFLWVWCAAAFIDGMTLKEAKRDLIKRATEW